MDLQRVHRAPQGPPLLGTVARTPPVRKTTLRKLAYRKVPPRYCPESAADDSPYDAPHELPRPNRRAGRVDDACLHDPHRSARVRSARPGVERSFAPLGWGVSSLTDRGASYRMSVMKLKWLILYLKYRRYILPGLAVLAVVVAVYFLFIRH